MGSKTVLTLVLFTVALCFFLGITGHAEYKGLHSGFADYLDRAIALGLGFVILLGAIYLALLQGAQQSRRGSGPAKGCKFCKEKRCCQC